jgi:DNA recombination protein RmuC
MFVMLAIILSIISALFLIISVILILSRSKLLLEITEIKTKLNSNESRKRDLENELETEKEITKVQQNTINNNNTEIAVLKNDIDNLNEKLQNQVKDQEKHLKTAELLFREVANGIFKENTKSLTETNKEGIETLLKPLGDKLVEFRKQVEDTYTKESRDRLSLETVVTELQKHTAKISNEANNLASALKANPQKLGSWGELILERVLEQSGLTKGREYIVQQSIHDNLRPDVIIKLPEGRDIIVDSKVSLHAYERFMMADDINEKNQHLSEHLKSTQNHIDKLSIKEYDKLETSLEYTMMFIPIEPAFLLAIQGDGDLLTKAFKKKIILVGPSTLMLALKISSDLWIREMQTKNALEIARRGELLYDKFVGFCESFVDIGKSIQKSQDSYEKALGQISSGKGNIINQTLQLKALGLKSVKKIPESLLQFNSDEEDEVVEVEVVNHMPYPAEK